MLTLVAHDQLALHRLGQPHVPAQPAGVEDGRHRAAPCRSTRRRRRTTEVGQRTALEAEHVGQRDAREELRARDTDLGVGGDRAAARPARMSGRRSRSAEGRPAGTAGRRLNASRRAAAFDLAWRSPEQQAERVSVCAMARSRLAICPAAMNRSCSAWRTSSAVATPRVRRRSVRRKPSSAAASVRRAISQLQVERAQRQVAVGHVGDERRDDGATGLLGGEVLRARGLVQPAHAAPHVELPAGPEVARPDSTTARRPRRQRRGADLGTAVRGR